MRNRLPWWLWLVLLVIVSAAGLGWRVWQGPKVAVSQVVAQDITQTLLASGRVTAQIESTLGSTLTARVAATPIAEGSEVSAGTALLQLDDSEAQAEVARNQANLAEAAATLAEASSQHHRQQQLARAGFISAAALDQSQKSLQLAQTRLAAAEAQVALAERKLAQYVIRAPQAGRVVKRLVEQGDLLTAGKAALTFAAAGPLELRVDADERYLARLRVGQAARVVADAFPDQPFDATVRELATQVDRERGILEVKLALPQPPVFLKHDMTVSTEIILGQRQQALLLPQETIRDSATAPWVWKVEQNQLQKTSVKIGLSSRGWVEIISGLKAGDWVVNSPLIFEAGQRIRAEPLSATKAN